MKGVIVFLLLAISLFPQTESQVSIEELRQRVQQQQQQDPQYPPPPPSQDYQYPPPVPPTYDYAPPAYAPPAYAPPAYEPPAAPSPPPEEDDALSAIKGASKTWAPTKKEPRPPRPRPRPRPQSFGLVDLF